LSTIAGEISVGAKKSRGLHIFMVVAEQGNMANAAERLPKNGST